MWKESERTELDRSRSPAFSSVRKVVLTVLEGPDEGATYTSAAERFAIGKHASNDLVLTDPTVSRFHCEVQLEEDQVRIVDSHSRNGTYVDGVAVEQAWARDGSILEIGQTRLQLRGTGEQTSLSLAPEPAFGTMVGSSIKMRRVFALLRKAATSNATVLLEGETGTGKEEAAVSLHEASDRKDKPLVVVDCSAISASLLESELFGHERGAFTGAVNARQGAFEAADGGTIFLDEIGELPMDLQPKLLRALERRTVRRVGGNDTKQVDVRIIAATNRDLRAEVNEGRFREDLYYRLAVLKVALPPLRERPDDLPIVTERVLEKLGASQEAKEELTEGAFIAHLRRSAWPGNVRELRNYLEQCLVLHEPPPLTDQAEQPAAVAAFDPQVSFSEARRQALHAFEGSYLKQLLDHHQGNVSEAARATGLNRVYLHRLLRRHGLRGE